MKNMKRIIWTTLILILSLALLTACTSPGLSEDFDEEEVKTAAGEVISYINNRDGESLLEISTVAVKNALTDEVLEEIFEAISEGGDFLEIEEISVGGSKDKDTEEEYAVAVAKTKYEHKNFIYTLSFTKQMKLAGIFYK